MNDNNSLNDNQFDIVPTDLVIRAMKDSGYQTTANALAELIDNSVQADADRVEVFCLHEDVVYNGRKHKRLNEIAVLDNGCGMDPEVLRMAMQFGNGTRLRDRSGIGRFGMGLPNSSISQCRRVEVWSWKHGPDNAMHTYLDIDEVAERALRSVPAPSPKPLPSVWAERSEILENSGTLVLWKNLEQHKLSWVRGKTTLGKTEKLVGRIYRKFIDSGDLMIRLVSYTKSGVEYQQYVRVNDPLYLMKNSSTSPPFDTQPMFQPWGDEDMEFAIEMGDKIHKVCVRMSYARHETVPQDSTDRGQKPYGRDAADNVGVSIVRERRELELNEGWAISYDPRERWWGAEIEFPATLDEIFGVTINKQSATNLSNLDNFEPEQEFEEDESSSEFENRIKELGDPRALLLPIKKYIDSQLSEIRKRIRAQTKDSRKKEDRHEGHTSNADRATSSFKNRANTGHETQADRETFSEDDRDTLVNDLTDDKDYPETTARQIANAVLRKGRRVEFFTKSMEGYAFFNVESKPGGLTAIVFNTNHPFYTQIVGTMDFELHEYTEKELLDKLTSASDTIELLFAAWARYEIEERKQTVSFKEMKQEWGKMAEIFLSEAIDT